MDALTVAQYIGWFVAIAFLLAIIVAICNFIYTAFLGASLGLNIKLKDYGPWAVVTGATDGIGKAYAEKFVSEGLNVVLVSRNPAKLSAVMDELKHINDKVKLKAIAVDFTKDDIYDKIESELLYLDIGILVNNVGMLSGANEPFVDFFREQQQLQQILNCNVLSVVSMTRILLPKMLTKKRGLIINLSSLSAAVATPFLTTYAATKAFVDKFSRDLQPEVKCCGVLVQSVLPGYVLTNMVRDSSVFNSTSAFLPNANEYVKAHVKTLGLESRTAGFWFHKLPLFWGEVGRLFFNDAMVAISMNYMNSVKKS